MKKLLFTCVFVLLTKCTTEPVPDDTKIIIYAKSSVAEYLPLYIYVDSSFVGTLKDTVKSFSTKTPPLSDKALLKIDVTPGTHNLIVVLLTTKQDTFNISSSFDNILDDVTIQSYSHSSRTITIEMGQYVCLGIGNPSILKSE